MGKITIAYIGEIKNLVGRTRVVYDVPTPLTIAALTEWLAEKYGPEFRKELFAETAPGGPFFYQILVNGHNIWSLDGLETVVQAEDELLISIPLAGGQSEGRDSF